VARLHALCGGINRYNDSRVPTLEYAGHDARQMARLLAAQRGIYERATAQLLSDREATRNGIMRALDRLTGEVKRTDTVVILLSGHGLRLGGRFFFASSDADSTRLAQTALPWEDLVQRLFVLAGRSNQVIVLLDACHSGQATEATNGDLLRAIKRQNAGLVVLTSSSGSELSRELGEAQHGAFTVAVLEALQGKARWERDQLTIWDFLTYVLHRVPQITGDAQHPEMDWIHLNPYAVLVGRQ
jgi:uncharacterized caspase-like protein